MKKIENQLITPVSQGPETRRGGKWLCEKKYLEIQLSIAEKYREISTLVASKKYREIHQVREKISQNSTEKMSL